MFSKKLDNAKVQKQIFVQNAINGNDNGQEHGRYIEELGAAKLLKQRFHNRKSMNKQDIC